MKYLHIITSMDPRGGGPCQGIRNLAPRAAALGHTVEVVCLDAPDADYLGHDSIPVHALGQGRGTWRYNPALRPWLEKHLPRFDAVILNGIWQFPAYLMSRLAQRPNTPPYFVFPHGMLDPWFQHTPGRRWKALRNWLYWKLAEQHVIGRARAVFFTCAEEMRLAPKTFRPYRPQRQINVGYGVSQPPEFNEGMADAFAKKCPGLNGRPYLLFLSRIHPKKGLDLMIKAYAAIYHPPGDNRRSSPPLLVIAGPGLETDYGKEMQKLATDLCPLDSVFWPGMLTGDAKWGALHRAEAYVLTSHQENFGIAVAEALACGTPVLISDQINICREIEEDQAGLVAEATVAGAQHLFRRWESLSVNDKATMARAAKACYLDRFVVVNAAKKMVAAMEELIGLPPGTEPGIFQVKALESTATIVRP